MKMYNMYMTITQKRKLTKWSAEINQMEEQISMRRRQQSTKSSTTCVGNETSGEIPKQ